MSVAGETITHTCDSVAQGSPNGFEELIVTLHVDSRGGSVQRTMLDYRYDGRPFTLVIDWRMAACGTEIEEGCN